MYVRNSLKLILNIVDLLVAEIRHLRAAGPHFRIVYRFKAPGSIGRLTGQEIYAAFLVYRGREYQLRLSLSQLIILDYLARHSALAQSARQIEIGIRADDFYTQHARNGGGEWASLTRRIPRSSIRVHATRLHQALDVVFHEAGLSIDPARVLMVQDTAGNEVLYRLKATFSRSYLPGLSAVGQ